MLDLNEPATFPEALSGGNHIVRLGVFTSHRDYIPHFNWHDLVETYIEAIGIAWTHLHPNIITDTVMSMVMETGSFNWHNQRLGWITAGDIATVAAAVLRKGPEKPRKH